MLQSGIVQRTVDLGESNSASLEQTWLVVQCADKAGLLAEIAQLITAHAHNIKVQQPAAETCGLTQYAMVPASCSQHCVLQTVARARPSTLSIEQNLRYPNV